MKKKALITGSTGQDAAWLSKFLLDKKYEVFVTDRRISTNYKRFWRLQRLGIDRQVQFIYANLEHYETLVDAIKTSEPDEVYNLGAQSFVKSSFDDEFTTMSVNFNGVHKLLKACYHFNPKIKIYQAGTSEMFGKVKAIPQNEETPFHPRSPYGVSKVAAFELTRHYRERYGIFACNGILFNHEGILRGEEFVTRKITKGTALAYKSGGLMFLGNIDAKRDWGSAKDYVEGMWLMLQQDEPDDYVLATGENHSVKEFLEESFNVAGEILNTNIDYKDFVSYNEKLLRPTEVDLLLGDATKAYNKLGWRPKTNFKQLVREMVTEDIEIEFNQK